MRFLRLLMFLLRLCFGVTFILSGFFKLTDPVGTGLIVDEYLRTLHLDFLEFGSTEFGMALSLIEFMIGIAVFMCVRMRVASWAGLVMTLFFTILTFFLALYGGIDECGCFGEAVHLTMWETFIKNVGLTACIVPIFMFRKRFKPVAPPVAEWAFLGTYGVLALTCVLYSYINIPLVEYGHFRVGTNLSARLNDITDSDNFETVFIYEKDGRQEYFDLDHLPDTSWTYVSTESQYLGDESDLLFDMTLSTADGEIVTEDLINSEVPVFIFVVLEPDRLSGDYWENMDACMDTITFYGGISRAAVPVMNPVIDSIAAGHPDIGRTMVYGDSKTLVSMLRSNGGVMLIHNGIVVKKWAGWRFSPDDVGRTFRMDTEEITARETISQRLFYESSILLLFLVIIIFRYICGIIYGRKFRGLVARERLRRLKKAARKKRRANGQ